MAAQDRKSSTIAFDDRLERFVRSAFLSGFFSSNVPALDLSPSADFEILATSWVDGDGSLQASEVARRRTIVARERDRLSRQDREKLARYYRLYDRGTMACFLALFVFAVLSVVLTMQADRIGDFPPASVAVQAVMFCLVAVRLSFLFLGQPAVTPTIMSKDIVFPALPEIASETGPGSIEIGDVDGPISDADRKDRRIGNLLAARERLRDAQDHLSVAMVSKDEAEVRHSVVMAAGGVDLAMTLTAPTFGRQFSDGSDGRR